MKDKIRVGFKNKNYVAKGFRIWSMRIDSALKLLDYSDKWFLIRNSSYEGRDGCVRQKEISDMKVDDELKEYIREKALRYDYGASVSPEERRLDIYSVALGTWSLVNPDFRKRGGN